MTKKTYYAVVDGNIAGAVRKAGDSCGLLTDRQAKYLVMSGLISTARPQAVQKKAEEIAVDQAPKEEPSPAMLGRKTR